VNERRAAQQFIETSKLLGVDFVPVAVKAVKEVAPPPAPAMILTAWRSLTAFERRG